MFSQGRGGPTLGPRNRLDEDISEGAMLVDFHSSPLSTGVSDPPWLRITSSTTRPAGPSLVRCLDRENIRSFLDDTIEVEAMALPACPFTDSLAIDPKDERVIDRDSKLTSRRIGDFDFSPKPNLAGRRTWHGGHLHRTTSMTHQCRHRRWPNQQPSKPSTMPSRSA